MREIKFRAFMRGEMHYNVGIHPHICCDHTKQDEEDFFYVNPKTTESGHFTLWNTDDKLMQYTGLKDKNGVEIYEGDIVAFKKDGVDRIEQVAFYSGGFNLGACIDFQRSQIDQYNEIRLSMTVIGNIYQNPELLTA